MGRDRTRSESHNVGQRHAGRETLETPSSTAATEAGEQRATTSKLIRNLRTIELWKHVLIATAEEDDRARLWRRAFAQLVFLAAAALNSCGWLA